MKRKKIDIPSFSLLRREAGQALGQHENRLTMIEALLMLMIPTMLYMTLLSILALEMGLLEAGFDMGHAEFYLRFYAILLLCLGAMSALSLFVMGPLVLGFFDMARRAAHGEALVLSTLFSSFWSGKSYRRALGLSWMATWRGSLIVTVLFFTVVLAIVAANGDLVVGICFGIVVLLELLWFFLRTSRLFFVAAIATEREIPLKKVKKMTRRWPYIRASASFFLHSFLWLLLALPTFGILPLWDTLPRLPIIYFGYARQLETTMIQSEEIKHE